MKKKNEHNTAGVREILAGILAAAVLIYLILLNLPAGPDRMAADELDRLLASGETPDFLSLNGDPVNAEELSGSVPKTVVFSMPSGKGLPCDIFLCSLVYSGGKFKVRSTANLSKTPDADESVFSAFDRNIAFASSVRGKFNSVTVAKMPGGAAKRFSFTADAREVRLSWPKEDTLQVSFRSGGISKQAFIHPEKNISDGSKDLAVSAVVKGGEHWLSTMVNYVRSLTGPGPIALLEEAYFSVKDFFDGIFYRIGSKYDPSSGKKAYASMSPIAPLIKDGLYKPEGVWTVVEASTQKNCTAPLLARTFIRPDIDRPYAVVDLLYIDLSRAEVRPVAGTVHPVSTTGIKGPGMIPDDPDIRSRLLCDFAGGFQAIHGNYGMMVDGDVLIPAQKGIATACFYADGRMKIGVWGSDIIDSPSIVSFRQNLPPLVSAGTFNCENKFWGYTPKVMKSSYTWRTGMGTTADNKLIYAIGNSLSAATLAKAMISAGVVTGMQLDMNISNVMCEIYDVEKGPSNNLSITAEPIRKGLLLKPLMYLKPQTRDFFYVIRKK